MRRAHRTGRSPWYFSSDDYGRFNLPAPAGTCYLAADMHTALRERFGHDLVEHGLISWEFATETVVSTLSVPRQRQLADLCADDAVKFGVTREIFTLASDSYAKTRQWARSLHNNGSRGIRYQSRFTTGAQPNAYALFDVEGERDWPTDSNPLPGPAACAEVGITVQRRPTRRQLRIIEP